jgi:rhodanese-related sulfurtransferase
MILDVRTEDEFNEGIIATAINFDIHKAAFVEAIESLDKNKNYYVYCRSGPEVKACEIMNSLGIENATTTGGIMGWNGDVVSP